MAKAISDEDVLKTAWHSLADNESVLAALGTSLDGLSEAEAADRLARCAGCAATHGHCAGAQLRCKPQAASGSAAERS